MSKVKIALLAGGVIGLLALAAFLLLMKNFDNLVKHAIETSASAATGTLVQVDSVVLSLREGQGTIRGLNIANPPGFPEQPLLYLDSIDIRFDPAALTAAVPVIEEIRVGPGIFNYEINQTGENNLRIVQKHAKRKARAENAANKDRQENMAPEKRFRIKRLIVADSMATIALGPPTAGQGTARVPGMTLSDLGGEQGATAAELATEIVRALGENLATAVGGGSNRLGDALNEAYRKLRKR